VSGEAARQLHCGDTITTNIVLHKDLVNCPNNGLIIGADGITLNLNGHKIDGDGAPAAGCDPNTEFCDLGVVNDGHDGVTVMHGSVREFLFGLAVGPTRHSRVLGLSTARNQFAGIFCFRCVRSLVRNSAANRTKGVVDEVGMLLFQSHHDRILNSSFRHNAQAGIRSAESTNTLIKGNRMSRNGGEGLIMEGGEGFQIRHNRLVRNGGGITLGPGSHNVIKRNRIFRARDGIRIEKGHGNLVAHNVVAHDRHVGIRDGIEHFRSSGGAHNVLRRNLVRGSRVDDFQMVRKARKSQLKDNVARGAGGDGFDIEGRRIKLTGNLAARNGDLGIEAVRGVIDGGGNRARHNGDPRQCRNIVCR
jgi:parallel beta-helix repeat protein